jgi:hypothetical protein
MIGRVMVALCVTTVLVAATPALGQSAAVEGRIVDQQELPVPGVTITLTSAASGLGRRTISDEQGAYRLPSVPPGLYDIRAALDGFATMEQSGTPVDVASIVRVDFQLRLASVAETVAVVARNPLVQPGSAVIGGVVDQRRIAELPLNGRQFANLAGTLPGVGVGFHRDPTKSTQYMPLANGGVGRNVAYIVDGGDNIDDIVGGPLQQFPLDAIQEFRFSTASYGVEHGRASGGVMNVVTRSGSNQMSGSAFDFVRRESLNSRTTSEERAGVAKPDYRRSQYGASLGGPLVMNKAHFFGALERVHQNTFQAVDTLGLFPALDGVFPIRYRDSLLMAKVTVNRGPSDRLAVRYGWNANRQPEGAGPRRAVEAWGDNRSTFHSLNASYTRTISAAAVNELVVQYATFANAITTGDHPLEVFPGNGVIVGRSPSAPQATRQRQVQLRDDVAWHRAGGFGVAHDLKFGVSAGFEPILGFPEGEEPAGSIAYTHLTNERAGPILTVSANTAGAPIVYPELNIPMTHGGAYVQDDWRATNRLTLNVGLRYDLGLGYQIDQSRNPNFAVLQQAAQAGRFRSVIGFEDFGHEPREDRDNIQPRAGFAFDLHGNGVNVIRGGVGLFTDIAFANNNILFAAFDARGSLPTGGFNASDPNGLRKPDGTFFRVGDPIAAIAALNQTSSTGLLGEVLSPRFEQPSTRQASLGWSHQLGSLAALNVDIIHADGRNLSTRLPLNSSPDGGPRRLADLPLSFSNPANFRIATSDGWSRYDALLLSFRRRTPTGIDVAASYTLSSAKSYLGLAVDESGLVGGPRAHSLLDAADPFAPAEFGPSAADARHRVSISAIVPVGGGVQFAPILYYRSALPVTTIEGIDRNRDSSINDLPALAYAFEGIRQPAKEIGACATVNCGRGAPFTQVNLRISKRFGLIRGSRVDLIAEVFNLFDASNPTGFTRQRLVGNSPNPDFMQPSAFAGDFQQPEQRVGQIGVRWLFGK